MANLPSDEQMEGISEALADGNKIEAIKIYREATDSGLKDSKDFIDELIPKLSEQDPEKYSKIAKSGGGCASVVILALLLSGTAGAATVVLLA